MLDDMTLDDVADLVATLRTVHRSGRTRPIEWRLAQLNGLEQLLNEHEADIAAALAADLGRSATEVWLADIMPPLGEIAYARKHLKKWMRPRRTRLPLNQRPGRGWIQYEPLGVVLVISPWNYPVQLTIAPLVGAIAAGNCVVVKPSEVAPATSALLADLLPRYVDAEAVVIVEGDGETSQTLLAQGFDHVMFTGGTEIGRKILAAAAPTLTPVSLELGGKSPVFVAADADLGAAARRVAWLKLMNSGQTCLAPDYLLVDRSVRERVRGHPAVDSQRVPLRGARFRHADRQRATVPAACRTTWRRRRERSRWAARYPRSTTRFEPTVILDPDPDEPAMCEEIFGPLLPVITVDGIDDAIRIVNARPKPLAVYAFSGSKKIRKRIVDEVPAGAVVFNHVAMHVVVPQLPLGGVGDSGMGGYHGEWGFQTFSHRKSVLSKTAKPDPRFVYPPYTQRALKLIRRMF